MSDHLGLILLMIAVIVAVVAMAWRYRDPVMVRLFGPPVVTLTEAYQESPTGPTFDHSTLDAVLSRHVDEQGWVEYEGLRADVAQLDQYIESVAQAPFAELGRNEKLALLINAYNAFTLRLILEHHTVSSIQEIPSSQRWYDVRWKVGEHTWSLFQIKNEQMRPNFREPRIHFALSCAAVGCPPLRNEAYVAKRVEQQLQDQAEYVHGHETWFQFDADRGVVRLTPLYNWYRGDFWQVGDTSLKYASSFSPELRRALAAGTRLRLEWLAYDWPLNRKFRSDDNVRA